MRNRFYFATIDNGFIFVEEEKDRLKLKHNSITYSSGINFIKDIVGVELNEEPDYDTIVDILKNYN